MNAFKSVSLASKTDSPLLSGIAEQDRAYILSVAEARKVPAKGMIVHSGQRASHLYILGSGNARYYRLTVKGKELLLRWLVPGDVFGLVTMLKDPPGYMGNAQADGECLLYGWTHPQMHELARRYPRLAENGLRIALSYLAAFTDRHARLVTETAEQRLANCLVHLGHRAGRAHPDGLQVDITNEQLGSLADVTLFTATRVLSKWEQDGAIKKQRGKILIQSPERLALD
jgi:CRP-like cAMP-binding protein